MEEVISAAVNRYFGLNQAELKYYAVLTEENVNYF